MGMEESSHNSVLLIKLILYKTRVYFCFSICSNRAFLAAFWDLHPDFPWLLHPVLPSIILSLHCFWLFKNQSTHYLKYKF